MSTTPKQWSRTAIEKLGKRLAAQRVPAQSDIDLLHELLLNYDAALNTAVTIVESSTGIRTTSRLKNTGTIIEKLRRQGGLPNIQDLAGLRIVEDMNVIEQRKLAHRIERLFPTGSRPTRFVDRTVEPMYGYRAIHVIVYIGSIPVEIQIRTAWQDRWANINEKLADVLGRGIRYGEPPSHLQGFGQIVLQNLRALPRPMEENSAKALDFVESREDAIQMVLESISNLSDGIAQLELLHAIKAAPEIFEEHPQFQANKEYFSAQTAELPKTETELGQALEFYVAEIVEGIAHVRSSLSELYSKVGKIVVAKFITQNPEIFDELLEEMNVPAERRKALLAEMGEEVAKIQEMG